MPAERLNSAQQRAVDAAAPLLIIAGAGSGKTQTLSHRVARLCRDGADPRRILLLTFSRRAADEMVRRARRIVPQSEGLSWAGTFHAVANRLLRLHAPSVGLDPSFTVLDRADSADLLDVVRSARGLSKKARRFPQKGTCLAIYSRVVNSSEPLTEALRRSFPWCQEWEAELQGLFAEYVDRKQQAQVLDYDDLLLYWLHLMSSPQLAAYVRRLFDHVLVDEYQDTCALQAEILFHLCPAGANLTVVGDDAQSIYGFRAATVRNILDFPRHYPGAQVVKLELNYRSTPPLVEATNRIIAEAQERHEKELRSRRMGGGLPLLVTCRDEDDQTRWVIERILAHREEGVPLRRQAVLFRTAHHSLALELELGRRNIPFHKYGGLKFLEAAHVKDIVSFLRLGENPRDLTAGLRVLLLLPGVGPAKARRLLGVGDADAADRFAAWSRLPPPTTDPSLWREFVALMRGLAAAPQSEVAPQLERLRAFYAPLVEERYDHAEARLADLEQLEQLAARATDRRTFLAELTLDPPASTQELAGPPSIDDDYLILSTIHSAKGLEWDAVYVIHAADGNIPSDLATGRSDEIEEERRLFYVATTRARDHLYVSFPLRYYHRPGGAGDRHSLAQLTRFLPSSVRPAFGEIAVSPEAPVEEAAAGGTGDGALAVRARQKARWA